MECTKDSRRALKTVTIATIAESLTAAMCICKHTAVSSSVEGCLKILNHKHRKPS